MTSETAALLWGVSRSLSLLAILLLLGAGAGWWLARRENGVADAPPEVISMRLPGDEPPAEGFPGRGAVPPGEGPRSEAVPRMPAASAAPEEAKPDFEGIAIELVRLRELRSLPLTPVSDSREAVRERMARWLAGQFPGDCGLREGRALAALGAIPEAVDTTELRSAFWSHQIAAWFDAVDGTLRLVEGRGEGEEKENALGLAFTQLFREHGARLFPGGGAAPGTDGWLARLGLLAGDAAFTRLRHALAHPATGGGGGVGEDPDDPSREVPIPSFLRERELAAFGVGMDFVRYLHGLDKFAQVNAAYDRPPVSCLELLEPAYYIAERQFRPEPVSWSDLVVDGAAPIWDDTLGVINLVLLLKQHVPQPLAAETAPGWRGDRLLVYGAAAGGRDHALWQTVWQDSDAADGFFSAMRQALLSRYRGAKQAAEAPAGVFQLSGPERHVLLTRTGPGAAVLLVDAADAGFAAALWRKFGRDAAAK